MAESFGFTKNAAMPSREKLNRMAMSNDTISRHAYLQFKHKAYPGILNERKSKNVK